MSKKKKSFILLPILAMLLSSCTIYSIVPEDTPETSEDLPTGEYFPSESEEGSDTPYAPTFTLSDEGGSWSDQSNLNIFNNDTFGSTMIAPGVSGTYTFNLVNTSKDEMTFSISLSEENEYDIAMVYKLDRDNTPVVDTWTRANDFKVEKELIGAGASSTFTLYWYWDPDVSDENDTKAGQNGMVYSLTITIDGYIAKFDDDKMTSMQTMSKALKAVSITLNTILIVIAALAASISVYVLIERYAYDNSMPTVFGYSIATVGSGSMEPTINTGDVIINKRSDKYEIEDIITYYSESESRYITHRIVGINEDGLFLTQGDREGQPVDSIPVSYECIVGKVVKVYPSGGFMSFITTSMGMIVVVISFIAVWVVIDISISAINAARKKDKQEKGENERHNEQI